MTDLPEETGDERVDAGAGRARPARDAAVSASTWRVFEEVSPGWSRPSPSGGRHPGRAAGEPADPARQ